MINWVFKYFKMWIFWLVLFNFAQNCQRTISKITFLSLSTWHKFTSYSHRFLSQPNITHAHILSHLTNEISMPLQTISSFSCRTMLHRFDPCSTRELYESKSSWYLLCSRSLKICSLKDKKIVKVVVRGSRSRQTSNQMFHQIRPRTVRNLKSWTLGALHPLVELL